MDRTRFRHLMDALGAAMQYPPEDRDEYLMRACGADGALLEEARELLADATATSLADVTLRLMGALERTAADVVDDRMPEQLGPYRILRVLGRGGMGVVYHGRQEEPLRRDVAIKLIRAAFLDRETLARFATERQALARMQHPAIARVYDASTTQDGLPYFVMELVEGLPITTYCERERLDLEARLELFRAVCAGVHHAHQRGIIHRDLKPSNVIVTTVDGRPVPKVIDFGVAKATDGILTDESMHTRAGSLIGTLDYMSPEQVRSADGDIDVRADIYSLGVILYELVSGRHPMGVGLTGRIGLIEAQRVIAEVDPPRPSSSLTITDGDSSTATDVATLRRRLREDLDWIVLKAMDKDRERRYQSALEIAQDLERHAERRPVRARPPSLPYRARKFVRRHRAGVAAAAVVLVALVSGGAMAGAGFVRATAEAQRAEAISGFLAELLASVRPDLSGRAVTVREVLDVARQRILDGEFSREPETQASLALVIGHSYEGLGRFGEARELLELSADVRRNLHDKDDPRLRASLYRLATVMWKQGALEESLALRHALEGMTRKLGDAHPEHVESLGNLGNTYADMGDFTRAVEYLREAVSKGRRLDGPDSELDLARYLNNIGTIFFDLEQYDSAVAYLRASLAIRAVRPGEDSDVYAITIGNLGDALSGKGELEEADRVLERALELSRRVFGDDHPRIAPVYDAVAQLRIRQGRPVEAEAFLRDALAIRIATIGGSSYWPVAAARRRLAELLLELDRLEEAEVELRRAWQGLGDVDETSHPAALRVAAVMAQVQHEQGNEAGATMWTQRSVAQ